MKCKELSAPPSGEVDWVATVSNDVETSVVVTSQTWYAAREEGARLLGTLPWNITCVMQSTVSVFFQDVHPPTHPKKKKKKKSRKKSKSNGSPRRPV